MDTNVVRTFRAPDTRAAIAAVKAALGSEAIILSSREVSSGLFGKREVEIVAALAAPEPHPAKASAAPQPRSAAGQPQLSHAPQLQLSQAPQLQLHAHQARLEQAAGEPLHAPRTPAWVADERPAPRSNDSASELRQLRALVGEAREALALSRQPQAQPMSTGSALVHYLEQRGVQPELAGQLVAEARLLREPRSAQALEQLRAKIASRLQTARPHWIPGRRRVVALIGPPGVGKTTTVAKIAAHAVLQRSRPRIALVTVDTYRIGAREHLARYGEILDVPVVAAKSVGELERCVQAQREADLVLIDTAGRSDSQAIALQAGLLRAVPEVELCLVLSASEGWQQLAAQAERYGSLQPERVAITKLDEAAAPGGLLTALDVIGKPICCIADGQRVPEDVHAADAADLAARLVGKAEQP